MARVKVIHDRYALSLRWILLAVKLRRVFTKTHHAAAVHLPHNTVCPCSILLDSLELFLSCMLHSGSRILLMTGNVCKQSCLIVHLFLQFLIRLIHLFELSVQVVSLTSQLFGLDILNSHHLFLIN
jgi:hypothetical protein